MDIIVVSVQSSSGTIRTAQEQAGQMNRSRHGAVQALGLNPILCKIEMVLNITQTYISKWFRARRKVDRVLAFLPI